jgi:acetyl esterase/lipase
MKRVRVLVRVVAIIALLAFGSSALEAQQANNTKPAAEARIESNVIYGMYSGLALLMDVHHSSHPNGYGVILIPGSGWLAPLGYDAAPLKNETLQVNLFSTPLLAAGYTVFVVDHRATPRFHYPAPVEDAQRAVRFIRFHARDYGINPGRIGAMGYSSGANLASMLGVLDGKGDPADPDTVNHESARVQCVVSGGTPSDLTTTQTPAGVAFISTYIGKPFFPGNKQMTEGYKDFEDASPLFHVAAGDPPFFLFHGEKDTLVPIDQAERFEQALEKAGVPAKLVRIPNATHVSLILPDGPDFLGDAVRWFDQYLKAASN